MFEDLSQLIGDPRYQHLILNHIPLTGLLIALIAFIVVVLCRHRPSILALMAVLGVVAGSIALVMSTGESAYDQYFTTFDDAGQQWLEHHEETAETWNKAYYALAAIALLGAVVGWKWPKTTLVSIPLVIILSVTAMTGGAITAESGGKINHPEFRVSPPPEHEHESEHDREHEHEHDGDPTGADAQPHNHDS